MPRPKQAALLVALAALGALGLGTVAVVRQGCAGGPDVRRDAEMRRLDEQARMAWNAGDGDAARQLIRQMADLDIEHPLIYDAYRTLRVTPGSPDEAREFLASLGSKGPGLTFLSGYVRMFNDHGRGNAPVDQARGYEEAASAFREALAAYRTAGHATGQAFCHYRIGFVLHRQAERIAEDEVRVEPLLEEAERELMAARVQFERVRDDSKLGTVLSNLGRIAVRRGQLQEALRLQRQAVEVLRRAGDQEAEAIVQMGIGRVEYRLCNDEHEVAAWESAANLSRQSGNRVHLVEALAELGIARTRLLDCGRAMEAATEALAVAEDLGGKPRIARTQLDLASVLLNCDLPAKALDALEQAAALFRTDGRVGPVRLTYLQGLTRLELGQLAEAEDLLEQALSSAQTESPEFEAAMLNDLGRCYVATGRLGSALAAQEQALAIDRDTGDRRGEIVRLGNLGAVHWTLGRRDVAGRMLQQAVGRARDLGSKGLLALPLENLALVQAERGQVDQGLVNAREALEIRTGGNERGRAASTRLILGRLLLRSGRHEEALAESEAALATFRELSDQRGQAAALKLQAEARAEAGLLEEALATYARVLDLAPAVADALEPMWAHEGRAIVREKQGRPHDALAEYEQAIQLLESQRGRLGPADFRMRIVSRNAILYEAAVELAASLAGGDGASAFLLAERARARGFADSLVESAAAYRKQLDPVLARRERVQLDTLAAAAARLDRATTEDERAGARQALDDAESVLLGLRFEMQQASPGYADLTYPEPATLQEVQRDLLRPGETMLAYFFGREHVWLWVVSRREARVQKLARTAEIEELLLRFREQIGHAGGTLGGSSAVQTTAEALAHALLGDVVLPPGERLLVIPHGITHHLPFEALRCAGRFLVEDHEVVLIPSATTLRVLRQRSAPLAAAGFLGLGDPTSAPEPLPEAAAELARIAELFPEGERRLLVGPAFTKAALLEEPLDGFRFVHFATHGRLDPEDPGRLALVLSENEQLYPEEVAALRLSADLVVLSACESGLGELVRGEGLVSMTRSFLYAGARSVVVSLWPVDDRSTAEFMTAFYADLRQGHSAPDALRRTKLAFLRSDRPALHQPARWASFVLVGDPR